MLQNKRLLPAIFIARCHALLSSIQRFTINVSIPSTQWYSTVSSQRKQRPAYLQ